jgi:DNA polymerase-3 subunit delta
MPKDLPPEEVLDALKKRGVAPLYLFYGPGEFRMERVLETIKAELIAEEAKDFNLEIVYGGEVAPQEVIRRALSLPFMAEKRLIIIRRTEEYNTGELDQFLPYLDDPAPSTCLIFLSAKTDFKRKFYKTFRSLGQAVHFKALNEKQVLPWIKSAARELGLRIDNEACLYLQQTIGSRLRDLYEELEKLSIGYGSEAIGLAEVQKLAIYHRSHSVFELMDAISQKKLSKSLVVLDRFLEEEEKKGGALRIVGMLNRQLRLLWQTKGVLEKGGNVKDVATTLGIMPYSAPNLISFSKNWSASELEGAFFLVYDADNHVKSGARSKPILENLIFSLCGGRD